MLDNTLTGEDIRESQLETVPEAALAGEATNADHATVAAGLDKVTYKTVTVAAPPLSDTPATAACDFGQRVVGGGVRADNPEVACVDDSYPDVGGGSWTAHIATMNPRYEHHRDRDLRARQHRRLTAPSLSAP